MASLAEYGDRIKTIFQTDFANRAGCYCIKLCINGIMRNIVIDENIPVIAGTNNIAFVHCLESEMWTMLLEKAWAKANQNYSKTIAGHTSEALKALTGAPTFTLQHPEYSSDQLWDLIIDADN